MGLGRFVLILSAFIYGGLGMFFLLNPVTAVSLVDITLLSPTAVIDIRATYGGFEIGMACFLAYCAWNRSTLIPGLIAVTTCLSGFALCRTLGIFVDGQPKVIIYAVLGVELAGVMFSFVALRAEQRKQRDSKEKGWEVDQEGDASMKENKYDVFISYASADGVEARQIYDAVIAIGGKAFLAEKSLRPGDDFAEKFRYALRSSRRLWLLVSPNSIKSEWVLTEWGAAWALNKEVVPILHRCGPEQLSDRMRRIQYIDFYKYPDLVNETFQNANEGF